MSTVYIETSVVSYLRNNPTAAIDSVTRQQITRTWWNNDRHRYELVTSQYVVDECRSGNAASAAERLEYLTLLPLLSLKTEIDQLAGEILSRAILPNDAMLDALHIACAAVHRVDYLLTWNCKHIANPIILPRVFRTLQDFGLPFPIICTPRDMMEEINDEPSE
jgi:predicted nucleic acid-binding protein